MLASLSWWIVLGLLLGWMGSWMFNRTLRTRVRRAVDAGARSERAVAPVAAHPADERPAVERVVERVSVDAAAVDERDRTIRALRGRIEHLEALARVLSARVAGTAGPADPRTPDAGGFDAAAARAAGFSITRADELEVIEGVGPRIAGLLRAEGLDTFGALARASPSRIRAVLDLGGPGFRIADPGTWPEQAALAAANRWADLKTLQDRLVAGRR